jgi:hypothetical protein
MNEYDDLVKEMMRTLTPKEREVLEQLQHPKDPAVIAIRAEGEAKLARLSLERVRWHISRLPEPNAGLVEIDALLLQVNALIKTLKGHR